MKNLLLSLLYFYPLIFPKVVLPISKPKRSATHSVRLIKFVWRGDVCYDLFAKNCSGDEGSTVFKTIKFLKGVYDTWRAEIMLMLFLKPVCLKPLSKTASFPA